MNKKELIAAIAKEKNLSKKISKEFVESIFNKIAFALQESRKVNINNFGIFNVIQKPEYEWFNPITKEKQTIAAKTKVKFKIAASLKKQLNDN